MATGLLLAATLLAFTASQRFLFLWGPSGHQGFFRCALYSQSPQGVERECFAGADELLFREMRTPEGTLIRSWFREGAEEMRREVVTPNGTHVFTRRVADCWNEGELTTRPEGGPGIPCEPRAP
jgi:hypothetical protein